jgi:hypothetical protein
MTVPYHFAATALKTIIDNEFTDLSVNAVHDRLHESLGFDGLVVGISPEDETPLANDYNTNAILITVQWYDFWDKQIDPTQTVDPFDITTKADRFRRAVRSYQASNPGSTEVWYFNVMTIRYLNDPTGNKTRFEATVRAFGDNPTAVSIP